MLERDNMSDAAEHLGNMLGLNVGLMAQHLSAQVLNEIKDKPERVVRAQQIFQKNMAATSFGQLDDLMNQAGQSSTIADTRRMYMLKSGYYTFINPLQLGAALAGAGEEQLEPIREFGEYAGLAFQLQDDLLGMFGEEAAIGKSSIDDLREGKMTLLMRHALAHADTKQLKEVRTALGNEDVTRQQHSRVCTILTELGTREYVVRAAQEAARSGLAVVATQTSWSEEGRECLSELVDYAVLRGN
jgi:geranylgeranyl pyrophosphate synthase